MAVRVPGDRRKMRNWMLYVVTVMVWGSTWLAIEFQLGVVPPEVSVFYRYAIATALLFAWCLARGLNLISIVAPIRDSFFLACCFFA